MNKLFGFWIVTSLLTFSSSFAQDVPAPAPAQDLPILLLHATIHPASSPVIPVGDILIENGVIQEVGSIPSLPKKALVFDLTGKHVWPGLIAPNTQLGLNEVESVRGTQDVAEVGQINPNVRALVAYNTDSRVIPTVRSNGILLAEICPAGGVITGTGSVVQLDAWNWEDAAYFADQSLHIQWPNMSTGTAPYLPSIEEQRKQIRESLKLVETALEQASAYALAKSAGTLEATDLRWEAMLPFLKGERKVFIHAQTEREIQSSLSFAARWGLQMVLVGGAEAHLCINQLRDHSVPVILQSLHELPRNEDDPIDSPFRIPYYLQQGGVLFCLSAESFWQTRNLPFLAGTATAYGLTPDQALQAVSLNTAKILGVENRTGSISPGKDANLVITAGDLLDIRTAEVQMAFIQGRQISLANKQKDLYLKYKGKYEGIIAK